MPRQKAKLQSAPRISDYISMGMLARLFPRDKVEQVLEQTGRASQRERALPARVMVYYVIALGLYMGVSCREVLRCLVEGVRWLGGAARPTAVACKAAISQARKRLGYEPVEQLYDQVVGPIGERGTMGAWYRRWRTVALDGSTLDVADREANRQAFGRPGQSRGKAAYPQIRFVSLVETGTHVLFGARMGSYSASEAALAEQVVSRLEEGMLCLADRGLFSFQLFQGARQSGADVLWRVKKNMVLPCLQRLEDGSYLSKIYPTPKDRRKDTKAVVVRVVEYTLKGVEGAEPIYRLVTSILDPDQAPAEELAVLYHERWEAENSFDELKTHLRGTGKVLRSLRPDLVKQEFYGLLMAHYAIRGLMHEAALQADEDPDRLSFVHAVRVLRRRLPAMATFSPSADS